MDAVTKQMQNLVISNDSLFGKDLTAEKNFLEKLFISFQQEKFDQKFDFSYYVGKQYISLCFERESLITHGDATKLVDLTEEYFASIKKLKQFGCYGSYIKDSFRKNNGFVTEFIFINYSPNRTIVDEKQQQPIDFDFCKCFYCATFFE